jgi:hypothetical protein
MRCWAVVLPLVLLMAGCRGRESSEGTETRAATVAEAATPEPPATDEQFRPFTRDPVPVHETDFPHDAHGTVACSVCHDAPAGHQAHVELLGCEDCHRSEGPARSASPEECAACHHDPNSTRTCADCHGIPGTVTTVQSLTLEVWEGPRLRTLDFPHDAHEAAACDGCHTGSAELTPVPCASCHEDHHDGSVTCVSCHQVAPAAAHGVDVHRTCSGAGCHRAPAVEAIATRPVVCLACHVEQTDHETGGDCIECHRVRGEAGGGR